MDLVDVNNLSFLWTGTLISYHLDWFFSRTHCGIPWFSENVMRLKYTGIPYVYNISSRNYSCKYMTHFTAKLSAGQNVLFPHILKYFNSTYWIKMAIAFLMAKQQKYIILYRFVLLINIVISGRVSLEIL